MSKIICDVCGTSYPETATQCPICGCVRPGDAVTVAGDTNEKDTVSTGTYTYVKGGRFSKANVKKRNKGKTGEQTPVADQSDASGQGQEKKDTGIVIAILAVLLAIVAVVIYIAIRFFAPDGLNFGTTNQGSTTQNSAVSTTEQTQDTQDTTNTTVPEIPCVQVSASETVIEFDKEGAALLLNVTPDPVDTTDTITFLSSDEKVATVTDDGKVVAVGGGQAVITIYCGSAVTECRVICNIPVEEPETTAPTISAEEFKLNRDDFTLNKKGETWKLYTGDIPADQIVWISDDEKVVTVKNGEVTAVGSGYTTVYGEYGGVKVSCIVRCADAVGKAQEESTGNENVSDGGNSNAAFSISTNDVTIKVGETFTLLLEDANGAAVNVTWTVADGTICTVSGNSVTGAAAGKTLVSVTHEGVTYSCIVRVTNG